MANINNKNRTNPMRVYEEFEELVNKAYLKQLDKGFKLKIKKIERPRITLAIANQYKKYPHLLRELEDADLK